MTYDQAKKISNNNFEILRLLFQEVDDRTYKRIVQIIMENKFLINFIDDLYFLQPLENPTSKTNWKEKPINKLKLNNACRNERLVALNGYEPKTKQFIQLHPKIFVYPQYFLDGRRGSFPEIYVREGVLESILEHLEFLPDGYGIMVYDGFRTYECQKDIYDEVFNKKLEEELTRRENMSKKLMEVKEYIREEIMPNYVSYPSFNPPSTHNTGGALDCRICDMNGHVLNYGCKFDEFDSVANLDYFEKKLKNNECLTNCELEALLIRRVTTNIFKYPAYNITYHYIGTKRYNSFADFNGEDWHTDINNQWDTNSTESIYGSCEVDGIIPSPTYTVQDYLIEREKIIKAKSC